MMKKESFSNIDSYLSKIIEESLKSTLQRKALQEKEKQDVTSKSEDVSSATSDPVAEKLKKGNVSTEDIVDKLNSIRSGKSFKDENISKKLDYYINDLSKAEKVALLALLKGISQIVTGEVDPSTAQDPSENPADIKMKKVGGPQKKHIKPTVIKVPEKEEKKSKSAEDTSGPVPIKPKSK